MPLILLISVELKEAKPLAKCFALWSTIRIFSPLLKDPSIFVTPAASKLFPLISAFLAPSSIIRSPFGETELNIANFGKKAKEGSLGITDMAGGTFTISNGGVYGSLMSSPILNPPQSGILGMHKIQKRPVAINDVIEIRPMMYLALSYDHRIIDGREAVSFLVRIKEIIEDPRRLVVGA